VGGLKKILVAGCEALEFIDCAENDIELLVLKNLPNLKSISIRENYFGEYLTNQNSRMLIIKNCPLLEFLDANIQKSNSNFFIRFGGEFNSFETFYYDEDTTFYFNNKQIKKEKL
jgi:hypothetical protein